MRAGETVRRIARRSFLALVTGGGIGLLAGGALASSRPPRRGLCGDADSGPRADPPDAWYGDRDTGTNADPLGRSPANLTDRDAGPNSDRRTLPRIGRCPAKPR